MLQTKRSEFLRVGFCRHPRVMTNAQPRLRIYTETCQEALGQITVYRALVSLAKLGPMSLRRTDHLSGMIKGTLVEGGSWGRWQRSPVGLRSSPSYRCHI